MPEMARRDIDSHSGICDHGAKCCPHSVTGYMIEGSVTTTANGKPVVRKGDPLTHDCPHCGTGEVAEGSTGVYVDGKPVSRKGDGVVYPGGSGTIDIGSPDVSAG